jgi:hypothetical protein
MRSCKGMLHTKFGELLKSSQIVTLKVGRRLSSGVRFISALTRSVGERSFSAATAA